MSHERDIQLKRDEITKLLSELNSVKKRCEEKDQFEKEILNNHQLNLRN